MSKNKKRQKKIVKREWNRKTKEKKAKIKKVKNKKKRRNMKG